MATLFGIRQLSDVYYSQDALTVKEQGTWENILDMLDGSLRLIGTAGMITSGLRATGISGKLASIQGRLLGTSSEVAAGRVTSALDDVEVMASRLRRLGYDQANTTRIIRAIENGEQVVIIGENMRRVNAVARMVNRAGGRSVTYTPQNWSGVSRNSLEANRSWIRYWAKDKGVVVIDIGRQPTPRPFGPSPFYGLENRSLHRWGIYTPFSE